MSTTTPETKPAEVIKVNMKAPVANGSNVQALLEGYRKAFEVAAPQHLDINRVMRVAIMTVSRNRDLLECTASSLLGAFMLSVQLGLDIGAKECHLVPYKNKFTGQKEVQLIPDYRGVAKLMRNNGAVINIRAVIVYKQDYFEYEEGLTPKLIHRPAPSHDFLDADIIAAYSVAHFKGGYVEGQVVWRKYLDRIRAQAKSKTGPWADHFAEMCRKTALKHHAKTLPQSVEIATAVELDNRAERERPQAINLLEDAASGRLLAEVPPDDSLDAADSSDLTEQRPDTGPTKLDSVMNAFKKTATPGEEVADAEDFRDIETAAMDAKVKMAAVLEHILGTMACSPIETLPKARKGEVLAWIAAHRKNGK